MSRIYRLELECGCMLSDDGGGGLIPCSGYFPPLPDYLPPPDAVEKHSRAWSKFIGSEEHKANVERCNQSIGDWRKYEDE